MASADMDDEIAALEARVEALKKQVKLEASTLLSNITARELLDGASARTRREHKEVEAYAQQQEAYKQQCLYRACASITTFKVRDPDPNAVDGGKVLGVRIEAMTRAKFIRPYYVLLNRPYSESSRALRVHRHTVPPCIPLAGLAARYLAPPTKASGDDEQPRARAGKKQDLARFVRTLRREIVRYHNRIAVIADLRKALGLDVRKKKGRKSPDRSPLLDISLADAEAKQLKVEWRDGRTGRLIIGDDGEVVKLVVFGEKGRDRDTTRELLGEGARRLEDVAKMMGAV